MRQHSEWLTFVVEEGGRRGRSGVRGAGGDLQGVDQGREMLIQHPRVPGLLLSQQTLLEVRVRLVPAVKQKWQCMMLQVNPSFPRKTVCASACTCS